MLKKELAAAVAAIRKFYKAEKRLPYPAELAHFGIPEWHIRNCGGITGLAHMAGLDDPSMKAEIKVRSLSEENQTLKSRIQDLLKKEAIKDALDFERLERELRNEKQRSSELQSRALDANRIRELIGTLDMDQLGHEAEWLCPSKPKGKSHGTAILNISDVHFGEVVDPAQLNGKNEFNSEIAEIRIKNLFRNATEFLKHHLGNPVYDGVVVNLIGDMVSGWIHEELSETNDELISESVFKLSDLLIQGIGQLADEFGKVFVACVVGNHGRFYKKPRAKNAGKDNWEWVIYQLVARYFKNDPRVSFLIPDGIDAVYSIHKKRILVTHGNHFNGGDGVTGVLSAVMRGFSKQQDKYVQSSEPIDMMMIGHFHTLVWYKQIFINGSVKGMDEYSSARGFGFEPPQQGIMLLHPERGFTIRAPIFCGSR